MKKIFIFLLLGTIAFSCSQKLRLLSDGTKVTDEPKNYKNISQFNTEILSQIDTSIIYKEIAFIQDLDSSMFGLNKSKKYRAVYFSNHNHRLFYRFYSNGYVNCFVKLVDSKITLENFNPDSTGYRGIFYQKKNGKICIELFSPVTGYGSYGVSKEYVTFSGDSMFVKQNNSSVSSTVFIKTTMTEELAKVKKWTN